MASNEFNERIRRLSPAKLVLLAEQLQDRVVAAENARREAVAIVGVGCRLPGGVVDLETYWNLLRDGVDAVTEVPPDRWDVDALYDPDPDAPGKMSTRWGGFLSQVDQFDPQFFGVAPREAVSMDPQQRLLLEVTWEALEHAGIAADRLTGTATGVFVGISGSDYLNLQLGDGLESIDTYLASGTAHSIASGRIAYVLGVQGPTFSVDTACSSSLVAVHSAVQSLRSGECNMALAGGVNLILAPVATIALSRAHMMAPDGRCKAFDSRANGFVRSEGAAMLVLKRLSDALAQGDAILAVIRGSAINQDGRSNGLTAPNGPAQEAVIRAALSDAGVAPAQVGYVETHGTGTSLGDPIEVQALGNVLAEGRPTDRPVVLGALKTNLGHLESAAGVAGLIKAALVIQRGEIPRNLHLERPNEFIDWQGLPVALPRSHQSWTSPGKRIAGVSSFGFSGTNAHLVLEQAPDFNGAHAAQETTSRVMPLSARTPEALRALAARVDAALDRDNTDFAAVCATLGSGRAHFQHRLAVVAKSTAQARAELTSYLAGEGRVQSGEMAGSRAPRVAFLFTGQGSQYAGMGRELHASEPRFREALERCATLLAPDLERPLLSVMFGTSEADAALLREARYAQPALFSLQYALAIWWQSLGVVPAAVLGHSIGEFAAACIAGALSLEDALRLVAARGRLMQNLAVRGAMAAVLAPVATVRDVIGPHVEIAAINGPESTVICGPASALEAVYPQLAARGIKSQPLDVTHAFHSALMTPVQEPFRQIVAKLRPTAPRIAFVSTLTGELANADTLADPTYWSRQLREPVQFHAAMETLVGLGCPVHLEIGPQPVLLGMAAKWLSAQSSDGTASMRRDQPARDTLTAALAALYVRGVAVDWGRVHEHEPRRQRLRLPSYPFQRSRYWKDSVSKSAPEGVDRLLFEVRWDEVQVGRSGQTPDAIDLDGVAARLTSQLQHRHANDGLALFEQMLPELDALCSAYIVRALRRLGVSLRTGTVVSALDVMRVGSVLPRHRRLIERFLEILAEDGTLQSNGSEWRVRLEPHEIDVVRLATQLAAEYPDAGAEIRLTARCGESLAEALTGAADPLHLLFPGGSLEDTEKLYQDSPVARTYNSVMGEALRELLPAIGGKALRVLEIGAGTGGTTGALLPLLPADRTQYVYTDASRLFLAASREKFSQYPFLSFATLDIGEDPLQQGFASASFDIIVAANVLHATADLRRTLANVRSLLAPGGHLLLLESGSRTRYADVTVGLTEGWWAFTDADLRGDYALLDAARWRTLLRDSGFPHVATAPPMHAAGILGRQAIILARNAMAEPSQRAGASPWVLVGAPTEAAPLADSLRASGDRAVVVVPGTAFTRVAADRIVVDAERAADYSRAIDAAFPGGEAVRIVHLHALAAREDGTAADRDPLGIQRDGTRSALFAAQAAAARPGSTLRFVTRGGQVTSSADARLAQPTQAPVWGLSHTVAQEYPELRCQPLDLDPASSFEAGLDRLVALLRAGDQDELALRGERVLARRLVRSHLPRRERLCLDATGSYLITGGLHGIGPTVARWLVERGARHLILVGRRGPETSGALLADLEGRGVSVHALRADVSDEEQMAAVMRRVDAGDVPPLRGVIHSAGIVDDALLLQQTWPHFERVMASKIRGTANLCRLLRGRKLDFVLLFSTGVSLVGSGGQANHAAANAYVDALAPRLRAQGLPVAAINWGAWADVGAAVGRRLALDSQGVLRMRPDEALEAMERIVIRLIAGETSAPTQLAVLPADWPRYFAQFPAQIPPLYDHIAATLTAPAAAAAVASVAVQTRTRSASDDLARQLESTPPASRPNVLRAKVRELAGRVLGLDSTGDIPLQQPLHEMGLDSLMAVQLRNLLAAATGRALPATLLFDCPTVAALTTFLLQEMSPPPVAESLASEDELAAALAARLDEIGAS